MLCSRGELLGRRPNVDVPDRARKLSRLAEPYDGDDDIESFGNVRNGVDASIGFVFFFRFVVMMFLKLQFLSIF